MRTLARASALAVFVAMVAGPAAAQQTREHILLYTMRATLFTETLPRGVTVAIDDTLDPNNPLLLDPSTIPGEDLTFGVRKTVGVCMPTDVDSGGVTDGDTHWVAYSLKSERSFCENDPGRSCRRESDCDDVGGACVPQGKFDRTDPRNQAIRVVDAFSDLRVDFNREMLLLEPASFDESSFAGVPGDGERYKCYQVRPSRKVCSDNPRIACRRAGDCPDVGEQCVALPRFPRQTHPDGLVPVIENVITPIFDAPDPDRPLAVRQLKYFCQSADTLRPGASAPDLRNEPQAGLLCYGVKPVRKACFNGENNNQPCRRASDCPGGSCREEPKLDNRDDRVRDLRFEDSFFQHHVDLRKEDVLCVPACKEPPAAPSFSPHVLRIHNLSLDTGGHAFSPLAGIANPLIGPAISSGSINILLEADQFADGKQEVHGYTGSLDPGNAGCDVNHPAVTCQYRVAADSLDPDAFKTRTSCANAGVIVLPVEIAGTGSTPAATLAGGGPNTSFSLELPFTDVVSLDLDVRGVSVSGNLSHDGTSFTALSSGILEGAVIHREFKQTASNLPQGLCQGGGNNNEVCFLSDALCPDGYCEPLLGACVGGARNNLGCGDDSTCPDPLSGNPTDACNETYIQGFTPAQLAGFIDFVGRDLDLDGVRTCEGATNNGEPCSTLSDCPDQNGGAGAICTDFESSSIRLLFGAIDAEITGVAP